LYRYSIRNFLFRGGSNDTSKRHRRKEKALVLNISMPRLLPATAALFAQLGGPAGRRAEWALAWHRPQFSSPWGFAARLERRSPRIGRWSRTAVKLTRLIVVRMAAWPVALAARLLARI